MTATATPPPKRTRPEDAAGSAGSDSRGNGKRAKRSRWEHEETETLATPPSSKGNLSEIVKRLSSVVKEKHASPEGTSVASKSAETAIARAKALAHASLLGMGMASAETASADLAKRVYVGNLYYDLNEEDVRNHFAPFGTIKSIDLSMEPGLGRSKGFCFIEYDDVLAAEGAVQVLNGSILAKRSLKVGRPLRGNHSIDSQNVGKEAIKNVATRFVYVGCISTALNSQHVQSIFTPFGDVRACVMVAVSPFEPTHRGYGFLEFADEAAAATAIQLMNGFDLAGQKLKVGKASPTAMLLSGALSRDKIVSSKPLSPTLELRAKHFGRAGTVIESRCLCLLNMVKVGEVDSSLRSEVQEECQRFGNVERVEIEELTDHVRVFVLFTDIDGAASALKKMQGRFFGGNQVLAGLYPLEDFEKQRYTVPFT